MTTSTVRLFFVVAAVVIMGSVGVTTPQSNTSNERNWGATYRGAQQGAREALTTNTASPPNQASDVTSPEILVARLNEFSKSVEQSLGDTNAVGEQRVAIILIEFPGAPAPVPAVDIRDGILNENNPHSITSWLRGISYGRTWLTGNVYGWYTSPTFNPSNLEASEIAQVISLADPSVDFSQIDRLIVIFSTGSCAARFTNQTLSTQEGQITLDSIWMSYLINNPAEPAATVFHMGPRPNYSYNGEWLGGLLVRHLGLTEANTLECGEIPYSNDPQDCMRLIHNSPFDINSSNSALNINAISKLRLGWINNSHITPVTSSGRYTLTPLGVTNGIKALKIHRTTCTALNNNNGCAGELDGYYYVEYRTPVGADEILWNRPHSWIPPISEQGGAVIIHADGYVDTTTGGIYDGSPSDTYLIDVSPHAFAPNTPEHFQDIRDTELEPSRTFTTPEGVTIRTISVNAQGAVIDVTFPTPISCPGDTNGDGQTNGADLSIISASFQQTVPPGTGADLNGDGVVDGRDLSVFIANFGCNTN